MKSTAYFGGKDLVIQVPDIVVQELQTTLDIPDRGTALIGGFTESPTNDPVHTLVTVPDGGRLLLDGKLANPAVKDVLVTLPTTRPTNHNLYLLVKPTLVITAPQKQNEFPLLESKGR